jgi:Plasmid encoded RepA protein
MGTVHNLILLHGVDQARALAETKAERQAVQAAAAVMAEERSGLGITHAGFAMTSLPHKRIDEPVWERQGYQTTLLIESGRTRQKALIGIPYGSVARLILLYLQTEAIRTGSPEIILGRSLNRWIERMDLTPGGKTRRLVSEQARRISACRLTFFTDRSGGGELRQNGAFVRDAISLGGVIDETQPMLWQEKVRLDEGFWRSLREHPVPVREEAIRAIGTRSLAIDVYVWLAYRLHSLSKPMPISWRAIHTQFGAGFALVKHLKPRFADALKIALAVYPEAQVDIERQGLTLHPSAPAVPKAEARRLGLAG